jgi:hypothetical protein
MDMHTETAIFEPHPGTPAFFDFGSDGSQERFQIVIPHIRPGRFLKNEKKGFLLPFVH